jgi:hypothetical protein
MSQVYFVSPGRVKRDTALGTTVDDNLIHPYIQMAQDRHIWNALGTRLYDKMKTDVVAGTVSGDYATLMDDYIQPCLTQFVFVELAYVMRLRASIADIKLVKEQAENMGMFYRERMVDYLCDKSNLYPEYSQNTGSDLTPQTENYFGNLNLQRRLPYSNRYKAYLQAIGDKSGIL